ncbi:UV damage repair protein UvrX [Bacillus songklensis]|uniref:UV damage repair protein UvrX n=2 Tax=Bacillus songklensis TaxID=1069116 RepID=A0ABV8B5C6_9BACI
MPQRTIIFVDMKSFFASIEAVERNLDPLKTLLVVVGDKNRNGSVVLASTPAMKEKFGIKTGNRLYEVPKIRGIQIVEARMGFYLKKSLEITKILTRFAPWDSIQQYSIDEAAIYIGNSERLFGTPRQVAELMKKTIYEETKLISCYGIGPNKFLAKVILDTLGKKQGIAECQYEDVPELLWPLPLGQVWGIGKRLEKKLNAMNIFTLRELAHYPLELLRKKFGVIGEQLFWHAHGIDLSPVTYEQNFSIQKGIGKGITLLRDYCDIEEIKTVILELCEDTAMRARGENLVACTISLAIGYSQYDGGGGFHRSKTMEIATNITMDIYRVCLLLLHKHYSGQIVRSVHVSLSNLEKDEMIQMSLFEDGYKQKILGYVMDQIRNKYGSTAILRGRSYTKDGTTIARSHTLGGHKW